MYKPLITTKRARETLDDDVIEYWNGLDESSRLGYYTRARGEVVDANHIALNYGSSHGGEAVGYGGTLFGGGRGISLLLAMQIAIDDSPATHDARRKQQESIDNEKVSCMKCDGEFVRKNDDHVTIGDRSICIACAYEHYPASAEMLDLHRPEGYIPLATICLQGYGQPDGVGRCGRSNKTMSHHELKRGRITCPECLASVAHG